jgi:transposase
VPLLSAVTSPRHLIADKAYDADSLRNWLNTRRIKAVIPSTATRTVPYPLDRAVYRRRSLIERLFCRLENWRRLAKRYDRLARNRRVRSRLGRYRVDLNDSSTLSLDWRRAVGCQLRRGGQRWVFSRRRRPSPWNQSFRWLIESVNRECAP